MKKKTQKWKNGHVFNAVSCTRLEKSGIGVVQFSCLPTANTVAMKTHKIVDWKGVIKFNWADTVKEYEGDATTATASVAVVGGLTFLHIHSVYVRKCRQNWPPVKYKKLIRRWDSERELSLRRHGARTTKYNRLVHKFRHWSMQLCVLCWNACVYQIQWNNAI